MSTYSPLLAGRTEEDAKAWTTSTASTPAANAAARCSKVCALVWQLRFLLVITALYIVESISIVPISQYIMLSFFAARHGGGDCDMIPSSKPCCESASDLALYQSVSSGTLNVVGAYFAVALGSLSDSVGRRPILRARAWDSALPSLALSLYVFGGHSLWIFLVIAPISRAFDTNGVTLAMISDVVPEPDDRGAAVGIFFICCIAVIGVVLPFAGHVDSHSLIVLSLSAGALKLVFMYTVFPETLPAASRREASSKEWLSSPMAALEVFGRHSFIRRMAVVLVISSVSSAGSGTVMSPYLTGYLGVTRSTTVVLMLICVIGGIIGLASVGHLVGRVGQVRAMQICLFATVTFPALSAACGSVYQFEVLLASSSAPLFMLMPIISGIKSSIVSESEQGLVQGALTAVSNVAIALADVFFGWFYRIATDGGAAAARSSVFPVFTVIAVLAGISWVLSLSLPQELPAPSKSPSASSKVSSQPMLGA